MQSIQKILNNAMRQAIRGLKPALVSMLILATIWNLVAIPITQATPRERRSLNPASKSGNTAKLLQGGSTVVVWGPQQVLKPPVGSYTAQFSLPNGAVPPYQLTISNGALNGTRKVDQARVRINGTDVFTPVNYNPINPSPQVRTVSLQVENTIEVTLLAQVISPIPYVTITITANQASLSLSPTTGTQGQTLSVNLTGQNTNWVAGQTNVSFGGEINVNSLQINSATSATAQITISSTAALGPRNVTVTTGAEVVTSVDGFTVNAATVPGPASSSVSTFAGSSGNPGFIDGAGASTQFSNLAGIAAGSGDVVYVADAGNHSIRRVASDGAVTTLAGNGAPGFFDGQGSGAWFNNPQGVAVDSAGNIYVADTGNHSIRRVATDGSVTTVAGDGTSGFVNGNGASARFNSPRGVAVDNQGQIYVAD
ncbi:MAG: hypothetical protein L0226_16875, partial [Acidobacteria bacterium]|nr:hypothetical protein [Acidobacteriota bacterium]